MTVTRTGEAGFLGGLAASIRGAFVQERSHRAVVTQVDGPLEGATCLVTAAEAVQQVRGDAQYG